MNSKLEQALHELYVHGYNTANRHEPKAQDIAVDEAEKVIRQAVGEEMLGLKPNNPYKTTDGQVPESFEAPAHAYDVANGDWEQKIKQWQGGEDNLVGMIEAHTKQQVLEAENNARYLLHSILSSDVDSELDHSDIEEMFVEALQQSKQKGE